MNSSCGQPEPIKLMQVYIYYLPVTLSVHNIEVECKHHTNIIGHNWFLLICLPFRGNLGTTVENI